jgi:1,4-alpha-glucan branching enzyme
MRRSIQILAVVAVAAGLCGLGCSSLNFIKRRLPPPSQTADGVVFRFMAPSARIVQLAGNWPENDWLRGQAQTGSFLVGEMKDEDGDGIFTRVEKLGPGRYQYKFVIDRNNWKEDPNNPNRTDDGYGGFNSLLDVR